MQVARVTGADMTGGEVIETGRDLDLAIAQLAGLSHQDELQIKRLKKRKLALKDAIAKLESLLIPDLNA